MNCVRHSAQPAVGQCQYFGAGLCSKCYDFSGGICYNCFRQIVADDVRRLKKLWTGFILWGLIFGILIGSIIGACTPDGVFNYGLGIGFGFYGFMGGAAFGISLQINKEIRITFGQSIIMAIISVLLGSILFVVKLVQLIKFVKDVKNEKIGLQNYPR